MVQGDFDTMSSYVTNNYLFDSYHSSDGDRLYRHERYEDSEKSYHSQSTAPTSYSSSPTNRPNLLHHTACDGSIGESRQIYYEEPEDYFDERRASVETYASTVPSFEDLPEDIPDYDVSGYDDEPMYISEAIPATPHDFSLLFPSDQRMVIKHDDATLDGNMNLCVDAQVPGHDGKLDMTLFHLRLHDLRKREFSLRRYCRDSGREVCHSVRKYQTPASEKRPGFQRSLTNALNTLKPKSDSKTPTLINLQRADSGYELTHSPDLKDSDRPSLSTKSSARLPIPTNTIKLEFSNYAQVDVKRRGLKASKHYSFEYWGAAYAWRRQIRKDPHGKRRKTTYCLTKIGSDKVLACISPMNLSASQEQLERGKGGWIAPSSMWIAPNTVCDMSKDLAEALADVIVSSGLITLVDDSIKQRFHSKHDKQLLLPGKIGGVEFVGPKRLINEVFGRRPMTSSDDPSQHPTPVRHYSHEA